MDTLTRTELDQVGAYVNRMRPDLIVHIITIELNGATGGFDASFGFYDPVIDEYRTGSAGF